MDPVQFKGLLEHLTARVYYVVFVLKFIKMAVIRNIITVMEKHQSNCVSDYVMLVENLQSLNLG